MSIEYHHPHMLVSTEWVEQHRHETDKYRIIESDEDLLLYETGHIPEAVKVDWVNDLNDDLIRDYISAEQFSDLCSRKGISNDTTLIFYGDKSNWWACYALWVFTLYGHDKCVIMDGGRQKWQQEKRPMSEDKVNYPRTSYTPQERRSGIRAFRDDVLEHVRHARPLVDVRSPQEYTGELTHMPDYPQEGALRAGHIPNAASVPWARAANENGTFKSAAELHEIYCEQQGLGKDDDVIAYCRIGERSSHTWFVLTHLLGFQHVRNYDGSWTEWGNTVGVPIEKP